jgi:hypothetical protein
MNLFYKEKERGEIKGKKKNNSKISPILLTKPIRFYPNYTVYILLNIGSKMMVLLKPNQVFKEKKKR